MNNETPPLTEDRVRQLERVEMDAQVCREYPCSTEVLPSPGRARPPPGTVPFAEENDRIFAYGTVTDPVTGDGFAPPGH
jgi:hypothetical protein